ncbi:class I SAM-dependent methyltransferase [Stenomitos frigidus]|uniref:Class I SAM-dependent methyltransferase n=1 Tax=Stenomitos frigidus ULC18 TaxID=2107698 RepID=A0A2T1ECL6_9CYAN|nr:class I SAM-dependent methyltransferase [Stenomitos frigidus]PSB30451.1 class I SAM-dependent methyltransferase [Stenomitos frigidus ULC18]
MVGDRNQNAYAAARIVRHYAQLGALQPAEQTVLDLLHDRLPGMKMLDIGVGGGRTTKHFAAIVADYTGIDYSTAMIAACKKRFAASSQTALFEVCDARDLSRFQDDSFDFILFSFNGIDYVSHADRLKVFQEVCRVGRPGGYFCFSSHNLQGLEREFDFRKRLDLNPLKIYVDLVMLALLRLFNPSTTLKQLNASAHVVVKDESHNFCLQTYYVRPSEQLSQLNANFSDVNVYAWKSGLNVTAERELVSNVDLWLYYLCVID